MLEGKKGSKVHFVTNSDGGTGENAHGESESIAFRSYFFLNTLAEDGAKGKIGFSAFDLLEETSHKEEEAFWSGVVTGAVGIASVYQDFLDPSESSGEFFAATVGVEEGENIHAYDRVETEPLVIKICLGKRVT